MARTLAAFGVLIVLGGAAAGGIWYLKQRPVPIAEIQRNAPRYDGREVRVHGTVTDSFDVLGYGVYGIKDRTGEVLVTTTHGAPASGENVTVRGVVVKAMQIQDQSLVGIKEMEKR